MGKKCSLKKILVLIILLLCVLNIIMKPQNDTKDFPDAVWGTPITFVNNTIMPHSDIEQIVPHDLGQMLQICSSAQRFLNIASTSISAIQRRFDSRLHCI